MQAADAITQAEEIAEQQKQAAAGQTDQVAKAVHSAAGELQKQMPKAAEFAYAAASQLEKGADALRNRAMSELMTGFNDLGRREPLALFGAALIAGFAVCRFLKSSADKSH